MVRILLFLAPKKRALNTAALGRISSIFSDTAQVSLGSMVFPALLDRDNPILIVWGIVITILLWLTSIYLAQKYHE